MKALQNLVTSLLLIIFITSCNQNAVNSGAEESNSSDQNAPELRGQSGVEDDESQKDILKIALGSKDHTTLVAAVQAAEMENVLVNAGPLTVFAPTNAAFDKLPEGTVAELLKPENKETLSNIITFHAAPGSYDADNIKGVMGIGQATGDKVQVEVKDGVTTVNGAKVIGSVKASNGWVHVIDGVLLPPE